MPGFFSRMDKIFGANKKPSLALLMSGLFLLSSETVSAEATGILMQQFYTNLSRHKDKRTSLREAQLFLRQSAKNHPFYWATFQLTGAVN